MENKDLAYIKKFYGEQFMHLCRSLFPTLLETEGLLSSIIASKFAPTHALCNALEYPEQREKFSAYIFHLSNTETKFNENVNNETPEQLMKNAGYILYPECQTEDDIQSFKKYYVPREELCTFDGGRLDSCRVWFAVKENVESINREDFDNPSIDDEYSTSVISIQFTRGTTFPILSIKSRYNHMVRNPDCTLNNNLDNIIPGLTESFRQYKKIPTNVSTSVNGTFALPNFVLANNGKYYKVVDSFGEFAFCENNVIFDKCEAIEFNKNKVLLVENYILDFEKKTVSTYKNEENEKDAFAEAIGNIKKMQIQVVDNQHKKVTITNDENQNIVLTINNQNQLIEYYNPYVTKCEKNFLANNEHLQKLDLPNAIIMDENCLAKAYEIANVNVPKLKTIGKNCFNPNRLGCLEEVFAPSLEILGDNCFENALFLKKFDAPNLVNMGRRFLNNCPQLKQFNAPNLVEMKAECFSNCKSLKTLDLPNLKAMEKRCFDGAENLEKINLPSLIEMNDQCFMYNIEANQVNMPNVESIGNCCFSANQRLKTLDLPKVTNIGADFFTENDVLEELHAPKLTKLENNSFHYGCNLKQLDTPSLTEIEYNCFLYVKNLQQINAPNLQRIGRDSFQYTRDKIYDQCNYNNVIEDQLILY